MLKQIKSHYWSLRIAIDFFLKRRLKFFGKNILNRLWPWNRGYYALLNRQEKSSYNFATDKHAVRHKHSGDSGWDNSKQSKIKHRDYQDYQEYVVHQQQKLDEMLAIKGGFSKEVVRIYRLQFYRRFRHLSRLLPTQATIICLGARQGTEVEVLQDIGYHNAYGLDLNPGPDNPWVRPGDFMHLSEADNSVDLVYSNAADHALNLDDFFKEHARVVKTDGYALYDFDCSPSPDGFSAVHWENVEDVILILLKYYKSIVHFESDNKWRWVLVKSPKR
ncbi:MAG: methyltransferase domain-containing protein [Magnetococcales bacterium]|nr:methyltransferase domain-containing protein [Magnetococcales bacterium]